MKEHAGRMILYLHGGGFLIEIDEYHLAYLGELQDQTTAEIYLPRYPLNPENTYAPTYKMLLSSVPAEYIIILGDSAGGGVALSFAVLLRDSNLLQPKKIILISPCLKLSELEEDEKKEDYIVNPLYGTIEGPADITVFPGTRDVLSLYNRQFCKRMQEEGRKDCQIIVDTILRERS